MSEVITNGLLVTASAAYGAGVTAIVVTPPTSGPAIPLVSSGQTMRCSWDGELIDVTLTSGTGNVNWTIARAQEGTVAIAHLINSQIFQVATVAGLLQYVKDTIGAGVNTAYVTASGISSIVNIFDRTIPTDYFYLVRIGGQVQIVDTVNGNILTFDSTGVQLPAISAPGITTLGLATFGSVYVQGVSGQFAIFDRNLSGGYFTIIDTNGVARFNQSTAGDVLTFTLGVAYFPYGITLPTSGVAIAGNVPRKVAQAFTSQTILVVTHNLGTVDVHVQVFNTAGVLIVPTTVTTTSINVVTITFGSSTSGRVVVIG